MLAKESILFELVEVAQDLLSNAKNAQKAASEYDTEIMRYSERVIKQASKFILAFEFAFVDENYARQVFAQLTSDNRLMVNAIASKFHSTNY